MYISCTPAVFDKLSGASQKKTQTLTSTSSLWMWCSSSLTKRRSSMQHADRSFDSWAWLFYLLNLFEEKKKMKHTTDGSKGSSRGWLDLACSSKFKQFPTHANKKKNLWNILKIKYIHTTMYNVSNYYYSLFYAFFLLFYVYTYNIMNIFFY